MHCMKCGSQIQENARFCGECGQAVAVNNVGLGNPAVSPADSAPARPQPPVFQSQLPVFPAGPAQPPGVPLVASRPGYGPQTPASFPPQGSHPPQASYPPQQGAYPPQQPPYPPQQPPYPPHQPPYSSQYPPAPVHTKKKKSLAWLWITLAVVVIGIIIGVVVWAVNSMNTSTTPTPTPRPTPTYSSPSVTKSEPTPKSTFSDSLVGSWTNILNTDTHFRSIKFTEDGFFSLVDSKGNTIIGTYKIISGNTSEGTIKCFVDDSSTTMEGDFHLNGNILTWGKMMFLRES